MFFDPTQYSDWQTQLGLARGNFIPPMAGSSLTSANPIAPVTNVMSGAPGFGGMVADSANKWNMAQTLAPSGGTSGLGSIMGAMGGPMGMASAAIPGVIMAASGKPLTGLGVTAGMLGAKALMGGLLGGPAGMAGAAGASMAPKLFGK